MTSKDDYLIKELLESFVSDPTLAKLESNLNSLNIMEAFKIKTSESAISAFLAWLLNPNENHGLGEYFLKYFLMECAKISKNFTAIYIDKLDLSNAIIRTEENFRGKRADITIKVEDDKEKFFCLIENKVKSSEGKNQTEQYSRLSEKKYPNHDIMFVLLSPSELEPSSKKFISINYHLIRKIIKQAIYNNQENLKDEIIFLLKQFNQNLEVNILEEGKIKDLCDIIYKKHKEAIEIILANKTSYIDIIKNFIDKFISEYPDKWHTHPTKGVCYLFKEQWFEDFKECMAGNIPFFTYLVYSWSKEGELNISVQFYIHKTKEHIFDIREKFTEFLDLEFPKDPKPFRYNRKNIANKINEIVLKQGYENEDDLKYVADKLKDLIDKTVEKVDNAARKLKEILDGS